MPFLDPNGGGKTPRLYEAGGASYPSVTEVLSVFDGNWMNAMLQRKGRRETARIMNEAATLGTKIHTIADALAWGRDAKVSEEMEPYAQAVREFLNKHVRRVIATELSLCSPRLGFGGTVDLVAELKDGSIAVCDYKSSAGGVTKTHKVQTAAYAMLARDHGYEVRKRLVVKIHKAEEKRGEWYVREAKDHRGDVETFKAALIVWKFLHGKKLERKSA